MLSFLGTVTKLFVGVDGYMGFYYVGGLGMTLIFITTKTIPACDKSGDKAGFMVASWLYAAPSIKACAYGPLAVHVQAILDISI